MSERLPLDLASFTHRVPGTDETIEVVPLSVARQYETYAEGVTSLLRKIESGISGGEARYVDGGSMHREIRAALAKNPSPSERVVSVGGTPVRVTDRYPCTCYPDEARPSPCPQRFALSECRAAAGLPSLFEPSSQNTSTEK